MAPVWTFLKIGNLPHLIFLAIFVGLAGGLGAVGFHYLINFFSFLFYGTYESSYFTNVVENMDWYWRLLLPMVGGLLVGIVIKYGKVEEAQGHGVPEVMEAVALERGRVRFRVAPLKTLTSALSIGSGGSAGREGPIIQIGSAIGSNLGNWFKLSHEQTLTLLASGAAAGVGGAFGAPLAGVIFAWEILLRRMTIRQLLLLLISAVTGTYVSRYLLGFSGPFFPYVTFQIISVFEIWLFIGLGFLSALVAIFYDNILHFVDTLFRSSRLPTLFRPAIGGLMFGFVTLHVPQVHETASYHILSDILLLTTYPIGILLILMLAKVLATALTLGSGGSGGIFAPALFIGATLGSAYGLFISQTLNIEISSSTSYALIGMAALFAAASHAPLTATVVVYEMTWATSSIIPLLVTCFVAVWVAKYLQATSIYTVAFKEKGLDIDKAYLRLNDYFKKGG